MSGLIDFEELCKLIELYKGRRVAITFHTIGDRDSVSSAVALSEYFERSTIVTPDFITRSAERMLEELDYSYIIEKNIRNPDLVIVVDANNTESLGPIREQLEACDADILFIDHHAIPKELPKNTSIFNDESYNSTASIVYEVLKRQDFEIKSNLAKLILCGIVADSADFKNATSQTFAQISELLKASNSDFGGIIYETSDLPSAEIRFKMIKDISKSTVQEYGNYLLIYGETKMHANEVAERALGLGADVSVFWSIRKDEVSISARMYPNLDKKLSLHLGKVMQNIAPIIKGSGGGHPCAAGAYGPRIEGAEDAVSKILSEIRKRMTK